MTGGELLDEEQRCTDVLVQECIDLVGRQLLESVVAAPGVIDDQRVEARKRCAGGLDDSTRGFGIGKVSLDELDPERRRRARGSFGIGTPRLRGVVERPAVDEDVGPQLDQAACDRESDPRTPADAGDERSAAGKRLLGVQVVSTPTTSRTASADSFSIVCSSSESSSSITSSIPPRPSLTGTPM